MTVTAEHTQY